MKSNQSQLLTNSATFGLIMAGVSFVLTLLYWILDFNLFSIGTSLLVLVLNLGITVLFFWLSNKTLRDKYLGGAMTYGQGFVNALLTGIASVIVGTVLTYVFHKYIAPDYLSKLAEKMLETLQSNPNVPPATLETVKAKFDAMTPEHNATQGLLYGTIFSVVFSLIISAFTKKNPDIFATENTSEEVK